MADQRRKEIAAESVDRVFRNARQACSKCFASGTSRDAANVRSSFAWTGWLLSIQGELQARPSIGYQPREGLDGVSRICAHFRRARAPPHKRTINSLVADRNNDCASVSMAGQHDRATRSFDTRVDAATSSVNDVSGIGHK